MQPTWRNYKKREMQAPAQLPHDLRRRLRAYSRPAATPLSLVLAWTAEGTPCVSLEGSVELDFEHGWPVLQGILGQAERPVTRRAVLWRWPDGAAAPAKLTLWTWLGRAVGRVASCRKAAAIAGSRTSTCCPAWLRSGTRTSWPCSRNAWKATPSGKRRHLAP